MFCCVIFSGKVGRSKTAFSSTRLGRSRSEEKLIESVAAAVTDSRYLEELQFKQQRESISSLHERLTERKVTTVKTFLVLTCLIQTNSGQGRGTETFNRCPKQISSCA